MHISFGLTLLWSFGSLCCKRSDRIHPKTPFSIIDCAQAAEKTGNWKENWSCKCWAIWAWIVFIKNSCNWNHLKLKIWAHPSGLVFVSVVVYSFWKLGKFCFFGFRSLESLNSLHLCLSVSLSLSLCVCVFATFFCYFVDCCVQSVEAPLKVLCCGLQRGDGGGETDNLTNVENLLLSYLFINSVIYLLSLSLPI